MKIWKCTRWSLLYGYRNPLMYILVFRKAGMKETGVCCSWCSLSPHPLSLCWLMMLMLAPAADLLRPSALSECLKCASQMFRVYTCWRHHLSHRLCGWGNTHAPTHTHMCGHTHFQMSMYQAEVHSCQKKKKKRKGVPDASTCTKKLQQFRQKCSNLTFYLSPYFYPEIRSIIMIKNW